VADVYKNRGVPWRNRGGEDGSGVLSPVWRGGSPFLPCELPVWVCERGVDSLGVSLSTYCSKEQDHSKSQNKSSVRAGRDGYNRLGLWGKRRRIHQRERFRNRGKPSQVKRAAKRDVEHTLKRRDLCLPSH